ILFETAVNRASERVSDRASTHAAAAPSTSTRPLASHSPRCASDLARSMSTSSTSKLRCATGTPADPSSPTLHVTEAPTGAPHRHVATQRQSQFVAAFGSPDPLAVQRAPQAIQSVCKIVARILWRVPARDNAATRICHRDALTLQLDNLRGPATEGHRVVVDE